MNTQRGFVNILITLLVLLIFWGGVYYIISKSSSDTSQQMINGEEVKKEKDLEDVEDKQKVPVTQTNETDMYKNGTYPALIKSIYESNGATFVEVDYIQRLVGKEAFLEVIKQYETGLNNQSNWDAFKSRYSTYAVLEKAIQKMSEEQFQDLYDEVNWEATKKNNGVAPSGIFNTFPNGMSVSKNESTKIRTLPLDKNAIIRFNNSSEIINKSNFIENKEYQEYYDFDVTTKNGVITGIEIIFKP